MLIQQVKFLTEDDTMKKITKQDFFSKKSNILWLFQEDFFLNKKKSLFPHFNKKVTPVTREAFSAKKEGTCSPVVATFPEASPNKNIITTKIIKRCLGNKMPLLPRPRHLKGLPLNDNNYKDVTSGK